MESRTQIVQKFASVAEHPEQCYEFNIQNNLDTFFRCEQTEINFSEAAFLIYDAARIYGRKVDYLEQIILDFNQRSATNINKAIAEKEQENKDAEAQEATKLDKKAEEQREKREREKERALKRAKRMVKVTSKIEFKPKPFEIATFDQISLNLHEERSELEREEEFDQLRMKNVFPRINVLQSNLRNTNTFYDNLAIDEPDCENLDSLRDFRIFMDTIDEPIFVRPLAADETDPSYEKEYKRSMERAKRKHASIYLPAEYIKENYGIELKDNSDYLNMLKYNEEVERLNLRKLSIEQLSKLKVGTYLNNILHGNKQDGKIPEHDSGIDNDDLLENEFDCPLPSPIPFDKESAFDELSTMKSGLDVTMTDLSNIDATLEDTLNISTIPSDDSALNVTDPSNISSNTSLLETTVDILSAANTSAEQSVEISKDDLNVSKETDRTNGTRQSLDDGIGVSECNSPKRLSDFEGFNSTDLTNLSEAEKQNEIDKSITAELLQKAKSTVLETNIFALPENLLRRNRIFALTEEYELWMAARKRKATTKPDPPSCGKLLKLSNGVLIRGDPGSDTDEFLGFDKDYSLRTAPVSTEEDDSNLNPAAIVNRTCSSDSGISPEKVINSGEECSQRPKTMANDSEEVNDSGVAELNSSTDITINSTTGVNDTLNNTANQSAQETDLSLSNANINANSTKLFNETASITTGFDSGFSELESQLESTAGMDDTNNGEPLTNVEAPCEMDKSLTVECPEPCGELISFHTVEIEVSFKD